MNAWGFALGALGFAFACLAIYLDWTRDDDFTQAYRRGEALHVLEDIWREHHRQDGSPMD